MIYRRDIDGLRAVAVLLVMCAHFGVELFSGGFVGVDVFFVISGYLITYILYQEFSQGTFSLKNFYVRRIRRLFPALLLVLFVCTIAALAILSDKELEEYGRSMIAVSLFSANVFFFQVNTFGYFDPSSDFKPLMHTWSLGVEEQFYLTFPLLLFLIIRLCKSYMFSILAGTALLSLCANVYLTPITSGSAFYLLHTRAWELALGSLIAISPLKRHIQRIPNECVALLGLALIIFAAVHLHPNSVFPGWNALYPCLGAALIIISGNSHTHVSRILGHKLVVYIGKISYSLYLWHWPIFAYCNALYIGEYSVFMKLAMFAATFALSAFSYHFVEQPFRHSKYWTSRRVYTFGIASGISVACAGLLFVLFDGFPTRFPRQTETASSISIQDKIWKSRFKPENLPEYCDYSTGKNSIAACTFGRANTKPKFLVWGDSHADAWFWGFLSAAKRKGLQGTLASLAGCPPLFGVGIRRKGMESVDESCLQFSETVRAYLADRPVEKVFIAARWYGYEVGRLVNGRPIRANSRYLTDIVNTNDTALNPISSAAELKRALSFTISQLRAMNLEVVVIYPYPTLPKNILNYSDEDELPLKEYEKQRSLVAAIMKQFSHDPLVHALDFKDRFCDKHGCHLFYKGIPLFYDNNHSSYYASLLVGDLIERQLES